MVKRLSLLVSDVMILPIMWSFLLQWSVNADLSVSCSVSFCVCVYVYSFWYSFSLWWMIFPFPVPVLFCFFGCTNDWRSFACSFIAVLMWCFFMTGWIGSVVSVYMKWLWCPWVCHLPFFLFFFFVLVLLFFVLYLLFSLGYWQSVSAHRMCFFSSNQSSSFMVVAHSYSVLII